MLDFTVIADVSKTLESVLSDALTSVGGTAEIHDLQGSISITPARVTLFLFETFEDPSARNRPPQREVRPLGGLVLHKPPMALELHYLLTPWGGNREAEHRLLGRTLQFFYDNAILSGRALLGSLAGTDQALKITLVPFPLEERTRVWHAVQKPYRLSLIYKVRVVKLVSTETDTVQPVSRRTLDSALPEGVA